MERQEECQLVWRRPEEILSREAIVDQGINAVVEKVTIGDREIFPGGNPRRLALLKRIGERQLARDELLNTLAFSPDLSIYAYYEDPRDPRINEIYMEWVEGETLEAITPFTRAESSLRLLISLLMMLHHYGSLGAAHTDLHWSNVMSRTPANQAFTVIDYGLACGIRALDPNVPSCSSRGTNLSALGYRSPLVLRLMTGVDLPRADPDDGLCLHLDDEVTAQISQDERQWAAIAERNDVHSAGVMVYESLFGHPPYDFDELAVLYQDGLISEALELMINELRSSMNRLVTDLSRSVGSQWDEIQLGTFAAVLQVMLDDRRLCVRPHELLEVLNDEFPSAQEIMDSIRSDFRRRIDSRCSWRLP